jgi:molybdopterin synthase catalytic subunit
MIRVQREDFDVSAELERLTAGKHRIGGVASFIGLVRDMGGSDRVFSLTLEHYPGMTEETPAGECWVEARAEDDTARERWTHPLDV